MSPSLHPVLRKHLQALEPDATFGGSQPRITSTSGQAYFVKLGSTRDGEQWLGEAESLRAMNIAAPGLAPKLFAFGFTDSDGNEISPERPFFLSEYKDMGSLNDASGRLLGKRLATEMHAYESAEGFGFRVPTYCGATRLSNGWFDSWDKCYSAMIGELLGYLRKSGGYSKLVEKGERVREIAIPFLLRDLNIKPVLLHGDLWSGNTGADDSGQPVIFDPASYYGHNEADLAIARIFGGLPQSFFKAYHEHIPKTDPEGQYNVRMDLYEMFHYLNHTVLFGVGCSVQHLVVSPIGSLVSFPHTAPLRPHI